MLLPFAKVRSKLLTPSVLAPCMMIGEKAAHDIREFWSSQFLVCDRRERLFQGTAAEARKCTYSRFV
jgi:hypothetical protein